MPFLLRRPFSSSNHVSFVALPPSSPFLFLQPCRRRFSFVAQVDPSLRYSNGSFQRVLSSQRYQTQNFDQSWKKWEYKDFYNTLSNGGQDNAGVFYGEQLLRKMFLNNRSHISIWGKIINENHETSVTKLIRYS